MPGRLDRALVERGLSRSRTHAQELITAGHVSVDGQPCVKPARQVADTATIHVSTLASHYVSRGALKLAGALDDLPELSVTGRTALDAGASTGGFTQVLLERGARSVWALDVGHGQLADTVRLDSRVHAREGVNVRDLDASSEGAGVDLVVADLSFISLRLVVGALVRYAAQPADFLLMIKPQFECGPAALDHHGVVRSPHHHRQAIDGVIATLHEHGVAVRALRRSRVTGPSGNVEFFVWGSTTWQASDMADAAAVLAHDIDDALEGGP